MRPAPALGAALLLALLADPAVAAEKMRITLQLPLTSHLGENIQLFEKEVEERTNGEMDVEIYDSAQLYQDKEVPSAVGAGSIEAGVASLTQYVGDVPAVDIFYMPFMFNTEEKVRAAVAEGSDIRTALEDAIEDTGGKILYWQAYGGAVMLTNGGPLKTPADLEGKKVRVFGKTLGDFVTAAGGSPTLISGSEQYLAYQRGTVDVGMTGVSGVASRQLWEVMDTITRTQPRQHRVRRRRQQGLVGRPLRRSPHPDRGRGRGRRERRARSHERYRSPSLQVGRRERHDRLRPDARGGRSLESYGAAGLRRI